MRGARWMMIIAATAVAVAAGSESHSHHDGDELSPHDASAHGGNTGHEEPIPHVMHHQHGMPILKTDLLPEERIWWESYNTTTYFSVESEHKSALYWHIGLVLSSFIFLYPVCLVLNNVGSSMYLPALTVHTTMVIVGLFSFLVFSSSIPDLYPNDAYSKMSWILGFLTLGHFASALVYYGWNYLNGSRGTGYYKIRDSVEYGSPSSTLCDDSRQSSPSSFELDAESNINEFKFEQSEDGQKESRFLKSFRKLYQVAFVQNVVDRFGEISVYVFNLLNWVQLFYFFAYLPTGVATFMLYGQGKAVFNLLAHFIKGGVFFYYGILSLARYCGAFTNKGWAWNHKTLQSNDVKQGRWSRIQPKGLCTMEFVESSLILFYGSTNIFLEHLSNMGEPYSAKDLQHASIAFIFIGCGLCGVLTEYRVNQWRYEKALQNIEAVTSAEQVQEQNIVKASPGFSPNMFPVLTIYWTGILMSKHQQASSLSTEIHTQWGNMFVIGCAFRFITYILMMVLPKDKNLYKPSRPISELIVSFALICGGLVFMESTDPVVYSFEYNGITSMFSLNVSLGVVALLMAWEMSLFAFKDWLIERRDRFVDNSVGVY